VIATKWGETTIANGGRCNGWRRPIDSLIEDSKHPSMNFRSLGHSPMGVGGPCNQAPRAQPCWCGPAPTANRGSTPALWWHHHHPAQEPWVEELGAGSAASVAWVGPPLLVAWRQASGSRKHWAQWELLGRWTQSCFRVLGIPPHVALEWIGVLLGSAPSHPSPSGLAAGEAIFTELGTTSIRLIMKKIDIVFGLPLRSDLLPYFISSNTTSRDDKQTFMTCR